MSVDIGVDFFLEL